jgi:hypothetical protein
MLGLPAPTVHLGKYASQLYSSLRCSLKQRVKCQAKPESDNVYISVTEPVELFGSTLYLLVALRSFGSVSVRYIKG